MGYKRERVAEREKCAKKFLNNSDDDPLRPPSH